MECSLLSNCLPKINQIWTHLSWAHQHQCHPLLNWKRNQKNLSWMTSHCLGLTHHGVFRKSVEHAFCATLYASCLFPSPSILEAKVEDRVYNAVVFCAGTRLDRGAEERWDMVSATEERKDTVE